MKKNNQTIAIYGIQDTGQKYPEISHDHSLAVFKNGKIDRFIQLERLTGKKHDHEMYKQLFALLKNENLVDLPYDTDIIFVDNVLGRSFINKEGNVRFETSINENLSNDAEKGYCYWINEKRPAFVLNHELAHIYSCLPFYGNFKENSLLVHFDGGASLGNLSVWKNKNDNLKLIECSWRLKYLSSFFNANSLVFMILGGNKQNHLGIPGKLMGFASCGNYSNDIEVWLKKNNYFHNIWRNKNSFFNEASKFINYKKHYFDQHDPFIKDIISTFHHIFERDFLHEISIFQEKTNTDYLYYSGGSALNIKTNTTLVYSDIFKDVFIPPCCNDSGLAIGAGAYLQHKKGFEIKLNNAYLNNIGIISKVEYSQETIMESARLLIENKIIALCNGNGEIGPRALGNRSLLSIASSQKLAKRLSMEIKKREWYRPLAPIMLRKNAEYFTNKKIHTLAKYMLLDFPIYKDKIKEIEGVVHIDGTSRIQVIFSKNDNPFMYDLLEYMDTKYKVRALINTSFNQSGEPMVHTENDAITSAKKMNIDSLILNGKLIKL